MITQDLQIYLNEIGIEHWQLRSRKKEQASIVNSNSDDITLMDWETLKQKVNRCTACGLDKTRTNTVFGVGNTGADLLIVGEAPGAHEDRQGEPFVGRAGQLLNAMLQSIGLNRQEIYITNILKCRPPNNRDPKPEETTLCTPYLERQVQLLQPKVIMAVGRIASHYLLNTKLAMSRLRGKRYSFRDTGIPLIVSYHPAYLLRSPREKEKAYTDLLLAKKILQEVLHNAA